MLLLLLSIVPAIQASSLIGCLELDSLTFNKTLAAFPFVVVKFDDGYPSGVKHKAYAEMAVEVGAKHDQLLVSKEIEYSAT